MIAAMSSTAPKIPIHIVCGPTASGKSAKAIEMAETLNGVIINCDSQQIYNGLPIIGAQPPQEDLERVPHKLYAHLHPNEVCSAGNWREIALPVIKNVIEQDKTPIICGGTGLYIKALIDGLSPMPDIPDHVRQKVVERYEQLGAETFYKELQDKDPIMAERFHVNHKARIIRAMEVIEATGKSLSEWQKLPRDKPPENWDFKITKVLPSREDLYKRCDQRFDLMMDMGALEEAQHFHERIVSGEINGNVPFAKALGFKQLRMSITGEWSLDFAIERAKADTRHYAKRQNTWFTNQI